MLTDSIVEVVKNKENLREFLKDGDFEKIQNYIDKVKALENLPYDKGKKWRLKYKGPDSSEKIGESWIIHSAKKKDKWEIRDDNGTVKIIHEAHIQDFEDCYLMYAEGLGGADEDIKISYKIRISSKEENIRDLSVVMSGASGKEFAYPDYYGYSVCTASNFNTEAKFQRKGASIVTVPEVLDTDTEYLIICERTGGRITRTLRNLKTGLEMAPLQMIDENAIYDLHNHFGFTTFSGYAEFYDIEVFTRKSMFSIDQFKISFDVEVGLRDEKLAEKVFKLRIGQFYTVDKIYHTLMFEDITERKRTENELRTSRKQLRDLAMRLQLIREDERSQIAREIHDELGQALSALKLDLYSLKKRLPQNQVSLFEKADSMSNLIDNTSQALQRISANLRPRLLDDLGLTPAIEWQLEEFEKRTGIKCECNLNIKDTVLDNDLSRAIFRIFQETLTNIARHANATSVSVNIEMINGKLELTIQDNGRGITKKQISNPRSFGLVGMRERLYPWGGGFEISGVPRKGTKVKVSIRLENIMEGSRIKILIVDDYPVFRKGLIEILSGVKEFAGIDEASNGQEVLDRVWKNNYDVIVLDLSMPGISGLDVLKQLRSEKCPIPVLVLSRYPEEQYAVRVLKAGADGYLTKESAPEELVNAIKKVALGGQYISPSLAEKLAVHLKTDSDEKPHERLSDREFQVMQLIASGKTVGEIADEMALSIKTISTYRTHILEKMNMNNNAQIMYYALKEKL
ncbi:MAG: hybrid sensor histidine kinase/response regulator transcription factor, partial [Gemmatimonadota bacterium]|nr:hybrid sensor histidine kinase/response regulator transcription factor [Gemmatimonadota bacterium]